MKLRISFFVFVISLVFVISCQKDKPFPPQDINPDATPYVIEVPKGFPTEMNIPEDNPMTVEGIELGRCLFYDGRMSGRTHQDSLMSCSSCHIQANSFECGVDHAEYIGGFTHGITGIPTPHVMLPMINLVWNSNGYLWNGKIYEENTAIYNNDPTLHFRNIESLVWMGVVAAHEMNGTIERTVQTISSVPMYAPMFKAAFGTEEVTFERISKAIAQFVRTLISSDSKFDKYLRGEYQLTPSELNGFVLFTTEEGADCFHCHGGDGNPLFTTNLFYNNGKDSAFTGAFEDTRDRYHVTGDPQDLGAYKATTLRNIEHTGPYMHDGRFATLEEVVNFYNLELVWSPYVNPLMHKINDGGAELIPQEIQELLDFIRSLEDTVFLNNPAYSNPRPSDQFFIN